MPCMETAEKPSQYLLSWRRGGNHAWFLNEDAKPFLTHTYGQDPILKRGWIGKQAKGKTRNPLNIYSLKKRKYPTQFPIPEFVLNKASTYKPNLINPLYE